MPIYYLDTSAVMKRYIPEIGSDVVEELFEELTSSEVLTTSYLTVLEVNSTVMRLLKGRIITQSDYQRILDRFALDIPNYDISVMPVQNELVDDAIGMVKRFSLRSLDALHIASAVTASDRSSDDQNLYVVSSDRKLVEACGAYRIPAIDPHADDALGLLRALR